MIARLGSSITRYGRDLSAGNWSGPRWRVVWRLAGPLQGNET